jgi:tetratricopeptide (TPR) repeat protein
MSRPRLLAVCLGALASAAIWATPQAPADPVSQYRAGLLLMMEEDWLGAVEKHLEALRANPAYADPMLALAECYYELGEYDRALSWAKTAEPLRRGSAPLLAREGFILSAQGKITEAQKAFDGVLALEPNNVEARFGLALLDLARGKAASAVKRYEDALRLSPLNARALVSLALVYAQTGSETASRAAIEQALRAHASDPRVRYYAGYLAAKAGSLAEAASQCRVALSLRADYPEARTLLATVALRSGSPREAADLMEAAVAGGKPSPAEWYLLGAARAALDLDAQALAAFASALKAAPDDEISRLALESLLVRKFRLEDPARAPWAAFHFARAQEALKSDERAAALAEFRRGLRLDPYNAAGRLAYAELLKKLGYPARYLSELRALRALGDTSEKVSDGIEAYEALLSDSVASDWRYDQFQASKSGALLAFYVLPGAPALPHADAPRVMADYLSELFVHSLRTGAGTGASPAESFAEAFKSARAQGADYFAIVQADEGERDVSVRADLYSARTGTKAASFSAYRSGNDRVVSAVRRVASAIEAGLAPRAPLIARDRGNGLVGLGAADGLKKGDELLIVKKGGLSWADDGLGLAYRKEDLVGSLTIARLDDEIAEGIVKKEGFFDLINAGDEVILKPAATASPGPSPKASKPSPSPTPSPMSPALYDLLKGVR